jgi:hypothetical protein
MRARLESAWRSRKWLEALGLIGGALVVVVAVAAVRAVGPSHQPAPSRETPRRLPGFVAGGDSPPGAVEAATRYLSLLADIVVPGNADSPGSVSALTIGPLKTELEQGLPVLSRALRIRLASAAAPAAFDGWPLGYRVLSVTAQRAAVSVWHLDVAASSTLGLMATDYATTTYDVRWLRGAWRIDRANSVPGPVPPPPGAPAVEVDQFARVVQAFSEYRYAP